MAWSGETPIAGCWAGRAANGHLACSPTLLGARVCYTLDQSPPRGKVTLMKKAGINMGAGSKTTGGGGLGGKGWKRGGGGGRKEVGVHERVVFGN